MATQRRFLRRVHTRRLADFLGGHSDLVGLGVGEADPVQHLVDAGLRQALDESCDLGLGHVGRTAAEERMHQTIATTQQRDAALTIVRSSAALPLALRLAGSLLAERTLARPSVGTAAC